MKGDIIDFNSTAKLLSLKPGSVIKLIGLQGSAANDYNQIGVYLMRLIYNDVNPFVSIHHDNHKSEIGVLWGNALDSYKFEIIKEI